MATAKEHAVLIVTSQNSTQWLGKCLQHTTERDRASEFLREKNSVVKEPLQNSLPMVFVSIHSGIKYLDCIYDHQTVLKFVESFPL